MRQPSAAAPNPALPQPGKAGRNERRKLSAALLNNLAAASLVAAVLQPALTLIRRERPVGIDDLAAALVFGVIGLTLHVLSQVVVARLED